MTDANLMTNTLVILTRLSRQELRDWIFARLHGDDMGISVDIRQDERLYSLLEHVYPDLDRHIREDVSNIVAEFVHDMACNLQSSWRGEPAHELLLLAHRVQQFADVDERYEAYVLRAKIKKAQGDLAGAREDAHVAAKFYREQEVQTAIAREAEELANLADTTK